MSMIHPSRAFGQQFTAAAALFAATCATGFAHIGYGSGASGRNFNDLGAFGSGPVTATNQNVTGSFGWADGTDADQGDSHKLRAYRFTLTYDALVSVSVQSVAYSAGAANYAAGLLPGFSIYSGLAHVSPKPADHDCSAQSIANRPAGSEGSFLATADWSIWNDGTEFNAAYGPAEQTLFGYKGYASDGTAANFGGAPGLTGDGTADGFVTGTFNLTPGDYTIFVGGANYAAGAAGDATLYGISTTLNVVPVPEPAGMGLAGFALTGLALRHRRP